MHYGQNHNSIFFCKDLLSYLSADSKQHRLLSLLPFLASADWSIFEPLLSLRVFTWICAAWWKFPFVNGNVSGHKCIPFVPCTEFGFSLDGWTANHSCVQYPFYSQRCFWLTETHTVRAERKRGGGCATESFPQLLLSFWFTWGHLNHRA